MSCVNIRGCRIGEGRPKVILPIVERTEAAILEKAAQFSTLLADCVEWRADWFEGFQSPASIARCPALSHAEFIFCSKSASASSEQLFFAPLKHLYADSISKF